MMIGRNAFGVAALLAFTLALAPALYGQDGPRRGGRGGGPRGDRGAEKEGGDKKDSSIKPFDEVITEEAVTSIGLFRVHRLKDKIYYEIPADAFGDEFLWVTQIEKTQAGFGYGGTSVGNRVIRWELKDEKVLLRDVKYTIRADVDDPVAISVAATSLEPIIKAFDVKAWGKDKSPVIDVTSLFTSDIKEFSAARRLSASGVDSSRTFIEEVKAFPRNIETKILMTYKLSGSGEAGSRGGFPRRGGSRRDPTQSAVTALIHHSMVQLPGNPMTPRLHDDRVGFFNVSFEDYADQSEHEVERVRFITRWRLEKQDAEAEVSDPVKPIVFYIGRGVPEKWRSFVKQGIEAWQPAFEAAGFSNAILAKDAPDPREDPDWDAEDARYSSIRWLPATVENAMGPHVHDPRTGEILESDILVYHNILKLVRDWYFTQASPNDERAQSLPMPDDLIGELLAYVIAHEVGHTLGFPHNMKASSSYTVDQLRDAEFTAKNGTEASIMDYGRFNYVAQPEDGASLIPVVGPYDFFAIEWGYRQFTDSATPEDDRTHLAEIVARQKDNPMFRFGDPNSREDPSQQMEDLGSDPLAATTLGLENIKRVMGFLVNATCREGEDYGLLENMYGRVISQRNRELGHVANVVGGVNKKNLRFGDADRRFFPVEADLQRRGVAFLNNRAFQTPVELIDEDILARLSAQGVAERILSSQRSLLGTLVSESRIKRMSELNERAEGEDVYTPLNLLDDLRLGIWSELELYDTTIDLYRRNVQRAHAELLISRLKSTDVGSDLPALVRGQLEELLKAIEAASVKATDEMTALHLKDMEARIDVALDPRGIAAEIIQTTAAGALPPGH